MTLPFRLGLTGSIGMGKTTTAKMFAAEGVPVWDADAAVDRLYQHCGGAVSPLAEVFPDAIRDSAVDRATLRRHAANPANLARIEAIVHPLVAADRAAFLAEATRGGAELVVFDIPLLFETGSDTEMDAVAVVSAPPDVQRARVMARPGMTEEVFAALLARQVPDADKRQRARWVIPTDTLDSAKRAVQDVLAAIRGRTRPDA